MMNKITWMFFLIVTLFTHTSYAESSNPIEMPSGKPVKVNLTQSSTPIPQRGKEYNKFLAASVAIHVSTGSGSGTIVYYDEEKKIAYVASCGHLWTRGTMSAEEGSKKNISCYVVVYYHNKIKLDQPKKYKAKLIFYSFINGQDTSLITFNPDWEPDYFPIAEKTYNYKLGFKAHSLGCDGGKEVAHYEVKLLRLQQDLITIYNSPRPGRSGGGLMDDNGYYIGTCWGTEIMNGSGQGFFTPLSVIHNFWTQQGYEFLLKKNSTVARSIPVINRNSKKVKYKANYVKIPQK